MKTETKHTPGPWKYTMNVGPTKAIIIEDDGSTIFWASNEMRSSKFAHDIQFMVHACNNYEQVKAELNESLIAGAHADALMRKALAERDKLAAALKSINQIVNQTTGGDWDEIDLARSIARAALAKLEGSK